MYKVPGVLLFWLYLEIDLLPYCVIGWPLRPMGLGSTGVVVEGLRPLGSQNCDWSVGWPELSWHLMAWEKGRGLGKDEAGARSRRRRKETPPSHTVNRWKAPTHFW